MPLHTMLVVNPLKLMGGKGQRVYKYPNRFTGKETPAEFELLLLWILDRPDWHEAAIKLDGGVEMEEEPLLRSIQLPKMTLTEYGKTKSKIGKWDMATRLLFVPMQESTPGAENMLISSKSVKAEAKDSKNLRIDLEGATLQAISLTGGKFHFTPVSSRDFLKRWKGFISKDKPNGFVTFYGADGKPVYVPVEFTKGEDRNGVVSLEAKVLNAENTKQLAADLKTATGVVVFVDNFVGGGYPG